MTPLPRDQPVFIRFDRGLILSKSVEHILKVCVAAAELVPSLKQRLRLPASFIKRDIKSFHSSSQALVRTAAVRFSSIFSRAAQLNSQLCSQLCGYLQHHEIVVNPSMWLNNSAASANHIAMAGDVCR